MQTSIENIIRNGKSKIYDGVVYKEIELTEIPCKIFCLESKMEFLINETYRDYFKYSNELIHKLS